jgi:type VI secretion system protein ImpA
MAGYDFSALLTPVAGDTPTGGNLEYAPAFSQLERLAEGRPAQTMGDQVIPAEEPDFRAVAALATDLLKQSKDLRIAARLTQAWLRMSGLPGLASGLQLIAGLTQTFWAGLHPENDPSDPDDPTRANVILGLTELAVLNAVRAAPLVEARGLGRFSYREIAIAIGEVPPPSDGGTPATMDTINAAFASGDLAALQETAAAARTCLEALREIEAAFENAAAAAPDVTPLSSLLAKIRKHLDTQLTARQPAEPAPAAPGDEPPATSAGGNGGAAAPAAKLGELRSREDVVRLLDKICEYYTQHEPSSPVPLLLKRARRLVTASFLDIVRNIAPDSVGQFSPILTGPEDEAS